MDCYSCGSWKPHISWPHCISHQPVVADRGRGVATPPLQVDKLLSMRHPRSNDDTMQTDTRDRDRRRWRLNFVRTDRRSGFDRRLPSSWSGRFLHRVLVRLRDDDRTLLALLAAANVLNMLDYLFTLRALAHGAEEANPFMRLLLSLDPVMAGAVKVALVLGASILVWRFRHYRLPLLAGVTLPAILGLVLLYHLYGLTITGV